eukprot:13836686-Ditylum_brightwellii.AAC.1
MIENGMDHMGLMEVNLDTMGQSVTKLLNEVLRKQSIHSQINCASFSIPVKEYYMPGGTLSMTQGNLVGQIIEKGVDKYGHWVYTKFATKNNTVITSITAYQPCKVTKKQGITTYHQQVALLQQDGHVISPWEAFTADLMKWLEEGKKKVNTSSWVAILMTPLE